MRTFALLAAVLVLPSLASAQTPTAINRTTVQATFNPSPDHNAVDSFGTPIVSGYAIETVSINSLGVVVFTEQVGKSAPVNNLITAPIPKTGAFITGGQIYQARVATVGPGGSGRSALSNSFGVPAPKAPDAPTGTPVIQSPTPTP